MTNLTIEKDEFTGLRKIYTPIFNLEEFNVFGGLNVMRSFQKLRRGEMKIKHHELSLRIKLGQDVSEEIKNLDSRDLTGFDLFYVENEDGQGVLSIRVYSMLFEDCTWPNWMDEWPWIVDGGRITIKSEHIAETLTDLEFKVYNLPIDAFSKISDSQEIKYSLRGKSAKIEGNLNGSYIKVFKAFEELCFRDENEGKKLFHALDLEKNKYEWSLIKQPQEESTTYTCYSCKANNIVPNNWDSFSCHKCKKDNTIIRPKILSDKEKSDYENLVIDLIKDNNVKDAISAYANNFGYTGAVSKTKVRELAEKNGYISNYNRFYNKKAIINLIIGVLTLAISEIGKNLWSIYKTIWDVHLTDENGQADQHALNVYDALKEFEGSIILDLITIVGFIVVALNFYRLFKKK